MTVRVQITGIKELQKALDGDLNKVMRTATLAIGHEIEQIIKPYPQMSEANTPGQRRWYERGFGPKWRSNPARRPKNRRSTRAIVYGPDWAGYRSSETLGRQWAVRQRGIGAIVGNKATYAPAVHHWQEQPQFHNRRGWLTDKEAVRRVVASGAVYRIVRWAVQKKLGGK